MTNAEEKGSAKKEKWKMLKRLITNAAWFKESCGQRKACMSENILLLKDKCKKYKRQKRTTTVQTL